MNVSPQSSGRIEIKSPNKVEEYDIYPTENITCFFYDLLIFTAKPTQGYKFSYWDFNIWPKDFYAKNLSKFVNPMKFYNTASDYPNLSSDYRIITAYFEGIIPTYPKNITATDGTEVDKIIINWDESEFATNYELYKATSLQSEKKLVISTNNLSFMDVAVIEGAIYYYWVKSVNKFGTSDFSNADSGSSYYIEPPPVEADNDGDGFLVSEGDCNDNNKNIYPGAAEICGNNIDEDCNGKDLECQPVKIDKDGDGYFIGYGDCNDNDNTIHLGAIEIPNDGIDQDCNGSDLIIIIDPNTIDNDGDGFSEVQGDCDDTNATIFPGAIEIPNDGIDQDCNGIDLKSGKQDDNSCFINTFMR